MLASRPLQQKQPPWRIHAPTAAVYARIRSRGSNLFSRTVLPEQLRASRSLLRAPSIRSNRRRIIQQKVPRPTQGVIRVRCLSHRRPWLEVVVLIARGPAATHRATRRGRTAAAVPAALFAMRAGRRAVTRDLSLALAQTSAAIHISVRMLIAVRAPVARGARRAIIRTRVISGTTLRPAVAIEATAVATRATRFEIAAASASVEILRPDGQRRVLRRLHVTRLAAFVTASVAAFRAARLCASFTTVHIHRSAAGGREYR
jgi:hypothetical protein